MSEPADRNASLYASSLTPREVLEFATIGSLLVALALSFLTIIALLLGLVF